MKKIIKYIIFIILLLINLSAFAESKINISLSEQNITLDKTFVVTVNIETTYTWSVEIVNIAWIDSFNRVWQENSSELSNFNWDIIKKLKLKISLKSNSTWNFVIWPALLKVWEKELKSNIVSINITKNTINQSIEEENTKNKKEQKEDIKTINKIFWVVICFINY